MNNKFFFISATWEISSGTSSRKSPHTTMITGAQTSSNGDLFTVGWDDQLKITDGSGDTKSFKLPSQPCGLEVSDDLAIVACYKHVVVLSRGTPTENPIEFHSTCVAFCAEKSLVAVGGKDAKVHVYKLNGDGRLEELKKIEHSAEITAVSFSDDGEYLAVTDLARKVIPYSVSTDFSVTSPNSWTFHTSKVLTVAWSPDNQRLATGSIDTSVIIWDMKKPGEHPVIIKGNIEIVLLVYE